MSKLIVIGASTPTIIRVISDINDSKKDQFEILGFDEVGYPDYLEYDRRGAKSVLSWWKFRMKRKSDDKLILFPIHYVHTFNDEGKIIRSNAYYSAKLLEE